MPDSLDNRRIFTLLEVARSIQKTLADRYTSAYWIKAEMNRLNLHPPSGHCYPELVEKKEGKIIAEMRSVLWKEDYQRINRTFLQVLKEPLGNGISILLYAKIGFDPVYGLSLRILDIDPSYSLGELEREKMETIARLKSDGLYDANRRLPMPLLPKRIAIISVETSKGYSDFIKTISGNSWGYHFFYMLFPAILQGERAVPSIVSQLRRISLVLHHFDAVAIIRGGGGEVGLTCYNDYQLSREIASFPIPVITGIGHSTNETVAEMIAHKNAITPTDLANYLLQQFHNFALPVGQAGDKLVAGARQLLKEEGVRLAHSVRYFRNATGSRLIRGRQEMAHAVSRLRDRLSFRLAGERRDLQHIEKTLSLLDPAGIMKRGYSITLHKGKLVTSAGQLKEGEPLTTVFVDGKVESVVTQSLTERPDPEQPSPMESSSGRQRKKQTPGARGGS